METCSIRKLHLTSHNHTPLSRVAEGIIVIEFTCYRVKPSNEETSTAVSLTPTVSPPPLQATTSLSRDQTRLKTMTPPRLSLKPQSHLSDTHVMHTFSDLMMSVV